MRNEYSGTKKSPLYRISLIVDKLRIFIILLLVIPTLSCSDIFSSKNEKLLIEKINMSKSKNLNFVDIHEIFGNKVQKICIQRPYELKEAFEKKSGMNMKDFEGLPDETRKNIWLSYKDGHQEVLNIPSEIAYDFYESEKIGNGREASCINNPQLLFFQ